MLRINRPGVHTPETIGSEMAWLTALRRHTDLGVPRPVAARDGSMVVVASYPGVPEPRACVLLGWVDGRFVDARLTPGRLRQVGALQGRLHRHAAGWTPPDGFVRPRVDTLTDAGKRDSIARSADASLRSEHPTRDDADRTLRLVADLVSSSDAALCARALEAVWTSTRELAGQPASLGLIHGDLHYANFLFHGGAARAIDFDDCGWGFYLYDLAISLWEMEERPAYRGMREAFLDEYAHSRPLSPGYADHIAAFVNLRRMQIVAWVLESREHATFREDWQVWARQELNAIAAALGTPG